MGFCTSADGLRLSYTEFGHGEPVLVLAGGPGMYAGYMMPIVDELARYHRVILPDQRGTGTSERPDNLDGYAMQHYVDDVKALREHIGIQNWSIVGHSWGGWLAEAYAANYPDHVSKLILIGSCGPGIDFLQPALDQLRSRFTEEDNERARIANEPARIASDPDLVASENLQASMPCLFADRKKGEAFRDSFNGTFSTYGIFGAVMRSLAKENYDLVPALRQLQAPALFIHGDYDHIPIEFPTKAAEAMPHARLERMERCGHFPWIEQPQRFFELIHGFID
jgi:proline iminopeptidase